MGITTRLAMNPATPIVNCDTTSSQKYATLYVSTISCWGGKRPWVLFPQPFLFAYRHYRPLTLTLTVDTHTKSGSAIFDDLWTPCPYITYLLRWGSQTWWRRLAVGVGGGDVVTGCGVRYQRNTGHFRRIWKHCRRRRRHIIFLWTIVFDYDGRHESLSEASKLRGG